MKTETLQELYLRELRDVYGGAKLLVKAIPKMMDRTALPALREVLANHLNETQQRVSRLEKLFESHGERPAVRNGKALSGILQEAEEDIGEIGNPNVRDAAIAAAAQQVVHYDIAAYGTLQAYSIHLGDKQASDVFQTILDEERAEDRKLTGIALNHLKVEAGHPV